MALRQVRLECLMKERTHRPGRRLKLIVPIVQWIVRYILVLVPSAGNNCYGLVVRTGFLAAPMDRFRSRYHRGVARQMEE